MLASLFGGERKRERSCSCLMGVLVAATMLWCSPSILGRTFRDVPPCKEDIPAQCRPAVTVDLPLEFLAAGATMTQCSRKCSTSRDLDTESATKDTSPLADELDQ